MERNWGCYCRRLWFVGGLLVNISSANDIVVVVVAILSSQLHLFYDYGCARQKSKPRRKKTKKCAIWSRFWHPAAQLCLFTAQFSCASETKKTNSCKHASCNIRMQFAALWIQPGFGWKVHHHTLIIVVIAVVARRAPFMVYIMHFLLSWIWLSIKSIHIIRSQL